MKLVVYRSTRSLIFSEEDIVSKYDFISGLDDENLEWQALGKRFANVAKQFIAEGYGRVDAVNNDEVVFRMNSNGRVFYYPSSLVNETVLCLLFNVCRSMTNYITRRTVYIFKDRTGSLSMSIPIGEGVENDVAVICQSEKCGDISDSYNTELHLWKILDSEARILGYGGLDRIYFSPKRFKNGLISKCCFVTSSNKEGMLSISTDVF